MQCCDRVRLNKAHGTQHSKQIAGLVFSETWTWFGSLLLGITNGTLCRGSCFKCICSEDCVLSAGSWFQKKRPLDNEFWLWFTFFANLPSSWSLSVSVDIWVCLCGELWPWFRCESLISGELGRDALELGPDLQTCNAFYYVEIYLYNCITIVHH